MKLKNRIIFKYTIDKELQILLIMMYTTDGTAGWKYCEIEKKELMPL